MILLDTSALYALTDAGDAHHAAARRTLERLEEEREELLLHTYVLVETFALLQRRHGLAIAIRVARETADLRTVVVDRALHAEGVAWLDRHRVRSPSLVDAVSFVVMRREGVEVAFAFDPDFERAGFRLIPRA